MITAQDKVEFKAIFGVPIEHFKSLLSKVIPFEEVGIDIIKFDKWLGTPDNISCNAYVTQKYGKKASKLIERVL